MSLHSFDPEIAARVGTNAAVLYQNILFWTQKNAANKKHIRDGYVWTYNSRAAFSVLFPYLTQSQIRTAMQKLVDSGLVIRGEYNAMMYDKTSWYAVAESANWLDSPIGQKSPMDRSEIANGLARNRQPIPDSKPDIREDTNVSSTPDKPKRARKSQISEDAEITQAMITAASKRGHALPEAEAQFQKFKNDALAKGKVFLSWDRAFITWLDSPYFKPITGGGNGTNGRGTVADMARRAGERWAARGMDSGQGGNSAVALFPTDDRRGGQGSGY